MAATVGVAVLFTDLVDSTALSTSTSAASAEDLRTTHFRLLRDALAANGGREVKNLGDGIMAVFPGVSSALDAAVTMQQSVDRHNEAAGHFRDAIGRSEGLRSPYHRARAMLGLAEVVQQTDPAEADRLLDATEELAEQYQMPGQLEGARALRN